MSEEGAETGGGRERLELDAKVFSERGKWKPRWVVLESHGEELRLSLYRSQKAQEKDGRRQEMSLWPLVGWESGWPLDREEWTLALFGAKGPTSIALALAQRDGLLQTEQWLRRLDWSGAQFPCRLVRCPSEHILQGHLEDSHSLRLHVCGDHVGLAKTPPSAPPKLIVAWAKRELAEYGPFQNKYCLRGASSCGSSRAGLVQLLSSQANQIHQALKPASNAQPPNLSLPASPAQPEVLSQALTRTQKATLLGLGSCAGAEKRVESSESLCLPPVSKISTSSTPEVSPTPGGRRGWKQQQQQQPNPPSPCPTCGRSDQPHRPEYINQGFIDSLKYYHNVDAILLPSSESVSTCCLNTLTHGRLIALSPAGLLCSETLRGAAMTGGKMAESGHPPDPLTTAHSHCSNYMNLSRGQGRLPPEPRRRGMHKSSLPAPLPLPLPPPPKPSPLPSQSSSPTSHHTQSLPRPPRRAKTEPSSDPRRRSYSGTVPNAATTATIPTTIPTTAPATHWSKRPFNWLMKRRSLDEDSRPPLPTLRDDSLDLDEAEFSGAEVARLGLPSSSAQADSDSAASAEVDSLARKASAHLDLDAVLDNLSLASLTVDESPRNYSNLPPKPHKAHVLVPLPRSGGGDEDSSAPIASKGLRRLKRSPSRKSSSAKDRDRFNRPLTGSFAKYDEVKAKGDEGTMFVMTGSRESSRSSQTPPTTTRLERRPPPPYPPAARRKASLPPFPVSAYPTPISPPPEKSSLPHLHSLPPKALPPSIALAAEPYSSGSSDSSPLTPPSSSRPTQSPRVFTFNVGTGRGRNELNYCELTPSSGMPETPRSILIGNGESAEPRTNYVAIDPTATTAAAKIGETRVEEIRSRSASAQTLPGKSGSAKERKESILHLGRSAKRLLTPGSVGRKKSSALPRRTSLTSLQELPPKP